MGGLIPLLLPSGGAQLSAGPVPTESRRRSTITPSSPSSSSFSHRRQASLPALKATKRLSVATPAAIAALPHASAEWKQAIDDVKRKYAARRYRSCSTRCCEILDNLKDAAADEPLYLIYLHFYAASSLEWCARPLSTSSTYRTKLLRDAQVHYDQAEALINSTEANIARKNPSASSSPTDSSLHSPELSLSSRTSMSSLSSPRTSLFSLDEEASTKPGPKPVAKPKKKVSFSGLPDRIEFQTEPYIRPDSPTLGWEDDFFPQQHADSPSLSSIPETDKARIPASDSPSVVVGSELDVSLRGAETKAAEPLAEQAEDSSEAEDTSPTDFKFDLEVFLQNRSANRICSQLSSLRAQISWHRDAVNDLLATRDDTPASSSLPNVPADSLAVPSLSSTPLPSTPSPQLTHPDTRSVEHEPTPESASDATDKNEEDWLSPRSRQNLDISPGFFDLASPMTPGSRPGSAASTASTIRGGDEALQQRIERLRASGWQRKRFNSRRYEVLREQVLGELGA